MDNTRQCYHSPLQMRLEPEFCLWREFSPRASPEFGDPSRGKMLWRLISLIQELLVCYLTLPYMNWSCSSMSRTVFWISKYLSTFKTMICVYETNILPYPSTGPCISHITHNTMLKLKKTTNKIAKIILQLVFARSKISELSRICTHFIISNPWTISNPPFWFIVGDYIVSPYPAS